jgi:outer membrane PBP1 activator LpoA protein
MTQRLIAFLILFCTLAPGAYAADRAAPPTKPVAPSPVQKTPEDRYLVGHACLQKSDTGCAQIALAGINPTSFYAKILQSEIAVIAQDFDTVLRLLIPLQAETNLHPAALASLHATLALAYENQGNTLSAVTQRSQADLYLEGPEAAANQSLIIAALAAQPRETLLEMRGESADSAVQGWIDLALALAHAPQRGSALAQWRQAYPDHNADENALSASLAPRATTTAATKPAFAGKIALLLPIDTPAFAFAAEAVRSGFLAAQKASGSTAEIAIYPTHGGKDDIAAIYRQALAEGAQYVVGPMTRSEVAGLLEPGLVAVPTLALNLMDDPVASPSKLIQFGLPIEDEAAQLARIARDQGMQTAVIASSDAPLGKRMAQAFASEWTDQGGVVVLQSEFGENSNLLDFKTQMGAERADMIFLAAGPEQARWVRPYLNQATPTFALSHIYDGNPQNPENHLLNAIHFIDMPWLLDADNPDYASYRTAAADLPPNAQRWFAVGVDAWKILAALPAEGISALQLRGLTGEVTLKDNRIVRELPLAQFRGNGVALE